MFEAVADFARLEIEPARLKDVLNENALVGDVDSIMAARSVGR